MIDPTLIQTQTLAPLAGGGLLGFAAGFAIKKIMKLAFIILGLFALVLGYLEYQKIISVNWTVVENQTETLMTHAAHKVYVIIQQMGHEIPRLAMADRPNTLAPRCATMSHI